MQKKLTITIDERALNQDLEAEYKEMAKDGMREIEALIWSEATIADVSAKPSEIYRVKWKP